MSDYERQAERLKALATQEYGWPEGVQDPRVVETLRRLRGEKPTPYDGNDDSVEK